VSRPVDRGCVQAGAVRLTVPRPDGLSSLLRNTITRRGRGSAVCAPLTGHPRRFRRHASGAESDR
jgi:hypothetical protein